MKHWLAVGCAWAVAAVGTQALAQGIPPDVAMRLGRGQEPHPLGDTDGRIPFTTAIDPGWDARALRLQPLAPGLAGVRLLPSEVGAFVSAHPELKLRYSPPLRPLLDVAGPRSRAPEFRNTTGHDGTGVIVGVVDTGLDLTHPDLRDASGHTRIAWLIDLSRGPTGTHPDLEAKYGCNDASLGGCAIFDRGEIDAALGQNRTSQLSSDTFGHGTHVSSIAAGNGLGSANPERRLLGMAPGATLIAAKATRSGEDVGDSDLLTTVQFVFDRAESMKLPVVVNLSLGGDFGPHDGTYPLEKGLAAMVGPSHPGRAIVVASGNSAGVYLVDDEVRGVHAEARVVPGQTTRVAMRAPDLGSASVKGAIFVWIGWSPAESISVGVEGPDGQEWISPTAPPGSASYQTPPGAAVSMGVEIFNDTVGGASPLTPESHGAVLALAGNWPSNSLMNVLLEGNGTVDLWVQGTGDAAPGAAGVGQLFTHATKQGTVSIPGTHPDLITVGATLNRSQWIDADGTPVVLARFGLQRPPVEDSVVYFSGAGPTRSGVQKPDLTAPGAFVAAAMSQEAHPTKSLSSMFRAPAGFCPDPSTPCMVVDDYHAIASGTSMASPMVAGAVALLLSLDPSLTQGEIAALLEAGARYPEGKVPYPYQMGSGALDLEGARLAYEALGRPIFRTPDPRRSWVAMGSWYARPDPLWRVEGILETRCADGTLADGFDPSQLELRTSEALVLRPLTRIAPGLWKFSVAAPPASGGGTMVVEVWYQGTMLGMRQVLPIGVSVLGASYAIEPQGGCAIGRGRVRGETDPMVWIAATFGVFGGRFRRRRRRPARSATLWADLCNKKPNAGVSTAGVGGDDER